MKPLFLFLHILMVLWLVAGTFGSIAVRAANRRAADLQGKVYGLRLAARFLRIYSIPGAIGAGLFGFGLVSIGGFGFSPLWVQLSIALYLAMLASTFFLIAPHVGRTLEAAEKSLAAGAATPEFTALAQAKLPGILADVNALGIVLLTFMMVFHLP